MALGTAAADAWSSGFGQGVNAYEAGTKRKLIMQQIADEQVDQAATLIKQQIEATDQIAASTPQRDENYNTTLANLRASIDDTLKGIGAVKTERAQATYRALSQIINSTWDKTTMTSSERNMAAAKAKAGQQYANAEAMVNLMQPQAPAPQAVPAAQQEAPGIAGPADMAAPAPMEAQAMDQTAPATSNREQMIQEMLRRQMEKEYGPSEQDKARTKMQFEAFTKLNDEAAAAENTLSGAEMALKLLDQGIYSGAGADLYLKGSKWTGADPEKVRRTEAFQAIMNKQVLAGIKALGSSTAVSDTDREFMMGTVGANINLNPESLRQILTDSSTIGAKVIAKRNEEARRLGMNDYIKEVPGIATQDGAPQEGAGGELKMDADGWVTGPGFRIRALP